MSDIPVHSNVLSKSESLHIKRMKNIDNAVTYGAITPRTSGDLVRPDDTSHPSSSSDSCLAEKVKLKKYNIKIKIKMLG